MQYQLNSFIKIFYRYNLIFYVFTIIMYILISHNISTRPFLPPERADLFILLGYYNNLDIKYDITLIFVIYQLFLTFLTAYTFINYERNNSPEFILLRTTIKKELKIKMIINLMFVLIWRILYFIFVYNEYHMKIKFVVSDFIYSTVFHLVLVIIIYLSYYVYLKIKEAK